MEFLCKALEIVPGVSVGENQLPGNSSIDPAFPVGIATKRRGRKLLPVLFVPETDACEIVCHVHGVSSFLNITNRKNNWKNLDKFLE